MNNEKIEIFRRTELFRDLDRTALAGVAARAVEKRLSCNELLFLAGERAEALYVIADGAIRAFRTGTDGREQIIHVERAVTTIAEVPVFDDGSYPSTAAAEEETTVYLVAKREVRELCLRHPQIALAAAGLFAKRLRKCAELVETLSLREVGQRVARLLLAEAEEHGTATARGVRFKQKLTHNQLAARVGTVREVVTRVLLRLQNQGLVVINGKVVTIPDPPRLAAYADAGE